jgi:tRNA 2-thiouridine synthesizing protein E
MMMEETLLRDETKAPSPKEIGRDSGAKEGELTSATKETCNNTDNDSVHIAGFSDWTPDTALALSKDEGMPLTEQHWMVILFMREYYLKHRSCPMLKIVLKKVNQMLGSQALNVRAMFDLFGAMPVRTAARYAGLPEPDACT